MKTKQLMKTRRYAKNVHPTERDRQIFAYLGKYGIASRAQLHRLFWPTAKEQTCCDRLNLLVKGGYLHTGETTARRESEQMYWIERKASLLFPQSVRAGFEKGRPAAAEIAHLLETGETVEAIGKRHTLLSFTNEHELKGEEAKAAGKKPMGRGKVADGGFRIRRESGEEQEWLLEIDGAYFGKRLTAKVQALGTAGKPVLWVVRSARRLATIQRVSAAHPNIRPILKHRI